VFEGAALRHVRHPAALDLRLTVRSPAGHFWNNLNEDHLKTEDSSSATWI
jgi:hypothetical protein